MKNIKYLFLSMLLLIPQVKAASVSTVISGSTTIKNGSSTYIYVSLDSSAPIKGVDITYSTTGNIKVTNVTIGTGLEKIRQNGNRYILYSENGIRSGSNVLILTVRGISEGRGTINITNLEATVDQTTVKSSNKSINITVIPSKTQEEIEKEEQDRLDKLEQEKMEEEQRKKQLEEALSSVILAERTNLEEDYNTAKAKVEQLSSSDDKTDLLKRLEEVRFNISVKKECTNNIPQVCECNTKEKSWIILSVVLLVCLIIESVYLLYNFKK